MAFIDLVRSEVAISFLSLADSLTEEHVDNPRGYDSAISAATSTGQEPAKERVAGYRISEGLRPAVHPTELQVDPRSGMKNYIANTDEAGVFNPTSADYVEKQLVAAITCGRQGDQQAYMVRSSQIRRAPRRGTPRLDLGLVVVA